MKSAKKIFTLLSFSIAVAFTGCSEPIGSLLHSIDYIKAVPSKTYYGANDLFIPARHLKVIGFFGGVQEEIDINKVKIKLIYDPGFTSEHTIILQPLTDGEGFISDNQTGLPLEDQGPYTVVLSYNNLGTSYSIGVGVPGTGGGGFGDGEDGSSLGIDWPRLP